MFRMVHRINSESLDRDKKELEKWLEKKIYYGPVLEDNYVIIDKFGNEIRNNCPESLDKSLFYITGKTNSYPINNHLSKSAIRHTWPLYFEKFPDGQIWLLEVSEGWWHEIWEGQIVLAKKTGYNKKHPMDFSLMSHQDCKQTISQ